MNDNISFRNGPVLIMEGHDSENYHMHDLSLIHISEPTRQAEISYAVFCLKKKKKKIRKTRRIEYGHIYEPTHRQ